MISRQKRILDLLSERGELTVNSLSDSLKVSEVTIRSDLNLLSSEGKIVRTHGSAQLLGERVKAEHSFEARKLQNFDKKIKIGKEAIKFLNPNDSFLLDSSSTVLAMAIALREVKDLKEATAIPTGIWTAMELMGMENLNVLIPGGYLRHTSGSITGLPTSDYLRGLNINKAFLGAWGISITKGITDSHLLEIELKKYIVRCAEQIIILADGSKFSQSGLASYGDLSQIDKIITDSSAPKEDVDEIRKQGIEIIVVE